VTAIIQKLQTASESTIDRLTRRVGFSLAQKASDIAVGWGNRLAQGWAADLEFARFLAVSDLNKR